VEHILQFDQVRGFPQVGVVPRRKIIDRMYTTCVCVCVACTDARVEPSAEVVRRKGAALPAPVPESRGMSRELPTFTWPHKIHEIRAKLRRYYARDQISGTPPALAVA
jgi:hypothetical protein